MLSPTSLINKKCFVCLELEEGSLVPTTAEIFSAQKVGNTFIIKTNIGYFDIASVLIQDSVEIAKKVCEIYNQSEGGVQNEQKQTSSES